MVFIPALTVRENPVFIFGKEGVHAAEPPAIINVHPRIELGENHASTVIWIQTSPSHEGVNKVRASLIKPGFESIEYSGEDTDFGIDETELIYNQAQDRYEVVYDSFNDPGIWKIIYQAQGEDGEWSDAAFGAVVSSGTMTDATIAVNLNQPAYQIGDQLLFSVTVNGQKSVDLYVAIMFPGGFFQTIIYPLNFSMGNALVPYQTGIELSGEKNFSILDFNLPQGIPHGIYTCYGVVISQGSDPWVIENWIHYDFKTFEMK